MKKSQSLVVAGFCTLLGLSLVVLFAPRLLATFETTETSTPEGTRPVALDKAAYDAKMLSLANIPLVPSPSTSTVAAPHPLAARWPVQAGYPKDGALLPFHRIIAYYGNFYSKKMGVLGEYEAPVMLAMLQKEKARWEAADPATPIIPAIHYIAVTAQQYAGEDKKHRLRMPTHQIDRAIELAKKVDGIVFIDIQVGLSTLEQELPVLEPYLKLPQVH